MMRFLSLLAIASACNFKFKTASSTSPATGGTDGSAADPVAGRGGAAVARGAASEPAQPPIPAQPVLDEATWASNAVAGKLGGTLVASGAAKDAVKIEFKAKKGWCYTIFLSPTQGQPELGDFTWSLPKKQTHVQRYYHPANNVAERLEGVCVTEDTAMRGERKVTFAGSSPRLRYAVVGWAKSAFPAHELEGMYLSMPDPCDAVAWKNIWTDPVPGTLLYWGSQPVLVESQDHNSIWVTVRDLHEAMGRARTNELTSKPVAALDVPSAVMQRPTCHCIEGLKAQYEYELTMASVAKEKATTSAGYKDADRVYQAAANELEGRIRKECRADEAALDRAWKATLDAIVDTLTRSPVPAGVSRVEVFEERHR